MDVSLYRSGARTICNACLSLLRRSRLEKSRWNAATTTPQLQSSAFSTSPVLQKRKKGPKIDYRITLIRYFLYHPKTPRPLRFSRLRYLRHWTIHRAWQLFNAKQRKAQELELERQYLSMRAACEALRTLGDDGMPGGANEGRLYRNAMQKFGIWQGVPIEYARTQTEWPSKEGWNHEWKRG